MTICDFCGSAEVTQRLYEAESRNGHLILVRRQWVCCNDCFICVEAQDHDGLLKRFIKTNVLIMALLGPKELLGAMREVQDEFWAGYSGHHLPYA